MPKRRRRHKSYWPPIILLVVIAVAVLGVLFVVKRQRDRHIADEAFQVAEDLFQRGAFRRAEGAYAQFRKAYPRHSRAEHAAAAEELTQLLQSVTDTLADPARVVADLESFQANTASSSKVRDRWPIVLTLAERTARSLMDRAALSRATQDMEAATVWLNWLHEQQHSGAVGAEELALDELDQLAEQMRQDVTAQAGREGFLQAARRAIDHGDAAQFAQAFQAYDFWIERAGEKDDPEEVAGTLEQLRRAVQAGIIFMPPPQATGKKPPPVPRLPIEAYTLLAKHRQLRPAPVATDKFVFARTKDLCVALDPTSGQPRWVLRVGYDAPMPQMVSRRSFRAVLVPWFQGSTAMVSLCEPEGGQTIWSWQAPQPLAGPPVATDNALFAVTSDGTVWQLDLATGTPLRTATLPEQIDSPPTLREDGGGLCVVGAQWAVYLFNLDREVPECEDVVLMARRSDTAACQAIWVPPYVVVFENDLMDRCYVRVICEKQGSYRLAKEVRVELEGRLWQAPVLDGATVSLVTDRWKEYCFGLDPSGSGVKIFTAAQTARQPVTVSEPMQPYFTRSDVWPFVVLSDSLHAYRVDRGRALLVEAWNQAVPEPRAVGVQPLQLVDDLLVAGYESPDHDGLLLEGRWVPDGQLLWQIRLGSAAGELASVMGAGGVPHVVARNDAGDLFLLSRKSNWQSRALDLPSPESPFVLAKKAKKMMYVSDRGKRIQQLSLEDWSVSEPVVQDSSVSSALTVCDGGLQVHGTQGTEQLPGPWLFYFTFDQRHKDHTLELASLDHVQEIVHGVELPNIAGADEPWTWSPLLVSGRHVVAAHPSGSLLRVEARRSEKIAHLFVTDRRTDLTALAAPPLVLGGLIVCIEQGGKCVAIDPASFQTSSIYQAPGAIRGGVVSNGDHLFLGLERSVVQAIKLERGELAVDWERELPEAKWQLTGFSDGYLFAVSAAGKILALDHRNGQIRWSHVAPAPLTCPPRPVGKELVMATVDGGLYFVPFPGPVRQGGN